VVQPIHKGGLDTTEQNRTLKTKAGSKIGFKYDYDKNELPFFRKHKQHLKKHEGKMKKHEGYS
jgi:hypothetical protein